MAQYDAFCRFRFGEGGVARGEGKVREEGGGGAPAAAAADLASGNGSGAEEGEELDEEGQSEDEEEASGDAGRPGQSADEEEEDDDDHFEDGEEEEGEADEEGEDDRGAEAGADDDAVDGGDDDANDDGDDDVLLAGGKVEGGGNDGARNGQTCKRPGCQASVANGIIEHDVRFHSSFRTFACRFEAEGIVCPVVARYRNVIRKHIKSAHIKASTADPGKKRS